MSQDIEYACHHEELLNTHSLKITELEKEIGFKKEKIDNLQMKIEEMDKKIDKINSNVNELVLASTKGDQDLELRLKAIETELETNKQAVQDNRNRFTVIISIITIFFTALTFIFNFLLH